MEQIGECETLRLTADGYILNVKLFNQKIKASNAHDIECTKKKIEEMSEKVMRWKGAIAAEQAKQEKDPD